MSKPVFVTQPALPPLDEYNQFLKEIWNSRMVTNRGPFHQEFEKALATYLGVEHISLFANGTLALITALQALNITGEVITTPFSFVATTHSLWWNNIKPVFADIDPDFFNLDPERVEEALTPQTTAILPVHVYGNPCRVDAFRHLAGKYGLKLIYDAAHAFGVTIDNHSVLHHGDLSVLSFHATKVFTTIEGGAIVCRDEGMKKHVDYLKNFGFADEVTIVGPGINAKMNELQAAVGLLQLNYVDSYISRRKSLADQYRRSLQDIPGIRFLPDTEHVRHSYTYFPVLIDQELFGRSRDEVYHELKKNQIFGRRYFYPLISQIPLYRELPSAAPENLPVATRVASQVLCLPLYPALEEVTVDRIVDLIQHLRS